MHIHDLQLFETAQILPVTLIPCIEDDIQIIHQEKKTEIFCFASLLHYYPDIPSPLPNQLQVPFEEDSVCTIYTIEYLKYLANTCIYPTWPHEQQLAILLVLSAIVYQRVTQQEYFQEDVFLYHRMQVQATCINELVEDIYGCYHSLVSTQAIEWAKRIVSQTLDTNMADSDIRFVNTQSLPQPNYAHFHQLMSPYLEKLASFHAGDSSWIAYLQHHYDLSCTGKASVSFIIRLQALINRYQLLDQLHQTPDLLNEATADTLWLTPVYVTSVKMQTQTSTDQAGISEHYHYAYSTWRPNHINPPALNTTLQLSVNHPQVITLQLLLNQLSAYYPAIPVVVEDGYFGNRTNIAVMTLQSLIEVDPTGIVDEVLWHDLHTLAHHLSYEFSIDTHLPIFSSTPSDTLQPTEIKQIQACLSAISKAYTSISEVQEDGIYGPDTRASILAFQQLLGLVAHGYPDAMTMRQLKQMYAELTVKM